MTRGLPFKREICIENGLESPTECLKMILSNIAEHDERANLGVPVTGMLPNPPEWSPHTQAAILSLVLILIAYICIVTWLVSKQFKKLELLNDEERLVLISTKDGTTDMVGLREIEEDSGAIML